MHQYLFVYGTLKRGFDHADARRLHRNAVMIGEASLRARLVMCAGYPVAVPSKLDDDVVHGELFRLATPRLLKWLDCYEDCKVDHQNLAPYQRVDCAVQCKDGETIKAWVYVANRATQRMRALKVGRFSQLHCWTCHS